MPLQVIATISFPEAESGEEGVVIVRAGDGVVGLALSLRMDGDMEVFLPHEDAKRLVAALQKALEVS